MDRLAETGGKAGPKFAKLAADIRAVEPAAGGAVGFFGRLRGAIAELIGSAAGLPAVFGKLSGLLGIGGAGVAGGVLAVAKAAANASEEMGKMSQRTGVGTESLSRLAYAAKLSDATTGDLEEGFKALADRMEDANGGGAESSAMFQRLGISVKNTDGTMRGVDEVFMDLAERFQAMPGGAEKTTLAIGLMDRAGLALIPTLNNGRKGLEELGEEANRAGVTISEKAAKSAADFNENIARLEQLTRGLSIEIGNSLIPALNALAQDFLNARTAGLSFSEALVGIGLSDPTKTPQEHIARLTEELDKLENGRWFERSLFGNLARDETIALKQKELEFFRLQVKEEGRVAAEQAAQRRGIEQSLLNEHTRLEKLRAVEAGLANADILKDDRTLQAERVQAALKATNEQINATKRLREALRTAWQTSIEGARQAKNEAQALFAAAGQASKNRNQQAEERLDRSLSAPALEEKNTRKASQLLDEAGTKTVFAQNAVIDGRADSARRNAEEALDLAKKAAEYVGKIGDDQTAADMLRRIGEVESDALRSKGKLREQESKAQESQAQSIEQQIQAAEQRLKSLYAELATPVGITLDITAAEAQIRTLQSKLNELNRKAGGGSTLTQGDLRKFDDSAIVAPDQPKVVGPDQPKVAVRADTGEAESSLKDVRQAVDSIPERKQIRIETVVSGSPYSDTVSAWNSRQNGFASGGKVSGPGTGTSDSILARLSNGEYVVRAAAVQRYGVDLLNRLNHLQLPRFAAGGLVASGGAAAIMKDSERAREMTQINLTLPGEGSFPLQATADVGEEIKRVFMRAALARGRRR